MASSNPPKRGVAYTTYVSLGSQASSHLMQTSLTMASGDVTLYKDGVLSGNIATLPTEIGTGGILVLTLSASEMTADIVTVRFRDAAGSQWQDLILTIHTVANNFDDLATQASVNAIDDFVDTEVPAILTAVDTEIGTLITAVGLLPTAAAIATAVWASGTRTLTSFGTLVADIWGYATRILTMTAAEVAAAVTGSDLHITRAVTYSATLTGLTIPVGWDKIYFTVKKYKAVADTDAIVQIVVSNPAAPLTDGLLRINKAAGTLAQGSLVVGAGTVDITLADDATALLVSDSYVYDIKAIVDSTSVLLTEADATVADVVTESIA